MTETASINQNDPHPNLGYEDGHASASTAPACASSSTAPSRQFACLYTKHKTQKRKVWQDGRLVMRGSLATLHDAHPAPGAGDPVLDQRDIGPTLTRQEQLTEHLIELEKFLVQIEGPWQPSSTTTAPAAVPPAPPSAGMQKVLGKKFQKPARKVPPPPSAHVPALAKRRRPLQPGELQRQYYGQPTYVQPAPAPLAPPPHGLPHRPPPLAPPRAAAPSPMVHAPPPPLPPLVEGTRPYDSHPNDVGLGNQSTRGLEPAATLPPNPSAPGSALPLGHAPTTTMASTRPTSMFASNGFDPSSFYGEDEEEEEDSDERQALAWGTEAPRLETSGSHQRPAGPPAIEPSTATAWATATVDDSPEAFYPAAAQPASASLSTNELLDLFGAAPVALATTTVHRPPKTAEIIGANDDFALPPADDSSSSEDESLGL